MPNEARQWQQLQTERAKQREEKRKVKIWQVLVWAGGILVGWACWATLAIYGPVLATEVGYQLKARSWLKPIISLELVPPNLVTGYSIVIPKIFVAEPVVVNVDPNDKVAYREALRQGIAQAAGTGMPGDGGLGYYFAHSSGMEVWRPQQKATFYLLGKLEVGDVVRIYKEKMKYEYQVVEKRVTTAGDVSFLGRQSDKEQIVLQTCWPIGTSLQRLLVFAQRVN